jgi:amidase
VIRINKENHTYYYDKENKPVLTASIGDKIIFETFDCWCNQLKKEEDLLGSLDMSYINPNTGPVFIKGAEAGDILVIKILDIQCEDHGILTLIPGEGILRQYVKAPLTKIVSIENGKTFFNDDIVIKNKPHIGTIGTTPFGRIPTGLIGIHGGNMDCPEAGVGAKIYFPIFVKGALLQMGDVHANMGEGEICIGVECGAEVTIEILEVIKDRFIPSPIIENKDYWFVVSNAPSLKEAVRIGAKRMADFVSQKLEISLEDATLLVSIVGNVRIAQNSEANYDVSIYVQFPKYVDKKGRLDKFYYD